MRLFLPAIPHTITQRRFSHCAFTMKVLNAAQMWSAAGFDVVHFGVEGAELPTAVERVELLTQAEHLELLGLTSYDDNPAQLIGDHARSGSPCYRQFNHYLRDELKERLQPGDVLCLPFGHAHEAAYQSLPIIESGDVKLIETGIGYPTPATLNRVYESEAWRHWVLGNEQREGADWNTPRHEWVIPNYYDLNDWQHRRTLSDDGARTVVYLGRLEAIKGLTIVPELARARPDLRFVLCGQGDPSPFCTEPNVEYHPPIHGRARAALLGNALCGIYPSRYVEPFCGAAVETMLCGTPVLTSDFGAFTETVIDGTTGVRCRALPTWLAALDRAQYLDRDRVRHNAVDRYSLSAVAPKYVRVFDELQHSGALALQPA
jgi:glycosyltransferase involved in cell wall biosynthesis